MKMQIEKFIEGELKKYERLSDDFNGYMSTIDQYVDRLHEMQCLIEDIKQYREDLIEFENKNKI